MKYWSPSVAKDRLNSGSQIVYTFLLSQLGAEDDCSTRPNLVEQI